MILIVGGAGYIGSTVNKLLTQNGYKTVILDDLSSGKKELAKWGELVVGNINDEQILNKIFTKYQIEAVMHFAAFKAAGESVTDPQKYYLNNVAGTLTLLKVMKENKVDKIIFSSSAATYGDSKYNPIDELHPQNPENPYGWTKLMIERILIDYGQAYGLRSVIFRYFNAVGAEPEADTGEWFGSSANLLPLVLDAAMGRRQDIKVFGTDYPTPDGTCIRDYIHVSDLANAHLLALEYLNKGGNSDIFNLGNGKGYSVKEVINAVKEVTGIDFKVTFVARRAGDPVQLYADSTKAKNILKWETKYKDIKEIVETAWKWHQKMATLINM